MRSLVLELAIKFLLSYFLGSIMGSMVIGRMRGGVDIRTMGSGNAGGTNAFRTQGWLFAVGVMLIDVGKGVIATGVVPGLELPWVAASPEISREWLVLSCAAAAVIGHVWPMWFEYRGGKGAATLVGTLIILAPFLLLPVISVWVVVLIHSGYVGLATIMAGISAPLAVAYLRFPDEQPVFIYCVATAIYLIFSHRSNIRRMLAGGETKVKRAMIFHRTKL